MGFFKRRGKSLAGYFYDGEVYCMECATDYGHDDVEEGGIPIFFEDEDVEGYCCTTCGTPLWVEEDV